MKILAVETSCDDTSVAVIEAHSYKKQPQIKVLANIVSSQTDLHAQYGGVVPELAARAHIENIVPALKATLNQAKCSLEDIDAIATTYGPGLIGSVLVGLNTAKALALSLKKPLIGVNHLEGHIYANFVGKISKISRQKVGIPARASEKSQISNLPEFPLLALIVSGGHTLLVYMKDHLNYKVVGQTIDDAAGEAFDKVGKLLELPYPAGPLIETLALKSQKNTFSFPKTDLTPPPKRDEKGFLIRPEPSLNFSFSGIKTAVLREVIKIPKMTIPIKQDIADSFQSAVVEVLIRNSLRAIQKYKPKTFLLSGGVACNSLLRKRFVKETKRIKINLFYPPKNLCTDNATMIGACAYFKYLKKDFASFNLKADSNLEL